MRKQLVCIVLLAILGISPAHAAGSDSAVDEARQSLRRMQESKLLALLQQADTRRQAIEGTLASLTGSLAQIEQRLGVLHVTLKRTKTELGRATSQLALAEGRLAHSRTQLGLNTLSLYATGQWGDIFTLLSAGSMASLASARVYMDAVLDSNTAVVDHFLESERAAEGWKLQVARQAASLERETSEAETQERRLLDLVQARQQSANALTAAEIQRARALAQVNGESDGFAVIVKSWGDGTAGIAQLVSAAQSGQPVERAERGSVWRPQSGEVVQGFGWRDHPIYHYRSFHTGIDIAAPYGSTIRAARAGKVLDVVYLGAFGLVTIIDHGFSVATMYAHQSRTLVRAGDFVQAGQEIGSVGCTGWCTGAHIHFEIWSSAKPQDPLLWL